MPFWEKWLGIAFLVIALLLVLFGRVDAIQGINLLALLLPGF